MQLKLMSVLVDDQQKALEFYTKILGFVKKQDFPVGKFRWLTVISPEGPDGIELLWEPNSKSFAIKYQKTLYKEGIAALALASKDVQKEFEKLTKLGVSFKMEPTKLDTTVIAMFDDTCGNYVQIFQI